jgi:histidinol-phosphate aminotransferase
MANMTRRQLLLGSGAFMGANLIPGIASTPFTPAMNLMGRAFAGSEIPRPSYEIRANANENPWGPSRVALQAINKAIEISAQYRFMSTELVDLIAAQQQVPVDHVVMGTGSSEILTVAGMLASMDKGSIVCADPTYQSLVGRAKQRGSEIIRVPVNEKFETDLNAMMSAIKKDTKLVYLVNPNNPIPNIIEKNALRDFILEVSKDRMVFVDEAYFEYVDNPNYASMMELIRDEHKNIIVARTASKIHAMAGLRVGFGFAHPDHIKQINANKTGIVNIFARKAAFASYQDDDFQNFTLRKNKESLAIVEGMYEELGVRYVKSNANFSFFETGHEAVEVKARMSELGVAVGRPFPPMTKWSRVSMAKPDEMRYFVQVYKKLYG